jgi:acetyltransferase-like isoleucine patch superfamily enzyme
MVENRSVETVTERMSKAKVVGVAAAALLPDGPFKRLALRRLAGWDLHATAHIGSILAVNVRYVHLGAGSRLSSFSVYRDLDAVVIGDRSTVGHSNWFVAGSRLRDAASDGSDSPASFTLGDESGVTSRHYVDCSGGVRIGTRSIIAGARSTVLTHQINLYTAQQEVASVVIGSHCFVGSNVSIVPGVRVADRCAIAMGAVVASSLERSDMLYAGVPARPVKALADAEFFSRRAPVVDDDTGH